MTANTLLMTAARAAAQADEGTLRVHTSRPRQAIEHFGASGCWSMDPIGEAWTEPNKERLAELLFSKEKGIGLSCWRFNIGAGGKESDRGNVWHPWRAIECFKAKADAPYDWSRHAGQQWFLRAAKRHGVERTLAFTNSPPVWLTRNGHAFCHPTEGTTNLREGAEADFAGFLADVLEHFAKDGLPFDYLSPVNEPCWDWKAGQEGCRYANDDLRRVLKAVGGELQRRGLRTHVDACDSGDMRLLLDDDLYRRYQETDDPTVVARIGNEGKFGAAKYRELVRELYGDPEVARILGGRISSHSYWTDQAERDLTTLRRLVKETRERHMPGDGGIYWQTEFCVMEKGRDLGMDTALRVAKVIHHDLTDAGASAWNWWLAVSPGDYKDGLIYTDFDHDGGEQSVLPSKTLWALGNYSRFLRPGARRLETEGAGDILASAYVTAAGQTVVVAVNEGSVSKTLRLECDAPVASWTPYVTDGNRDLAREQPFTGETFSLPARSVVTLVSEAVSGETASAS
jgi:hypothetical protein